MQMLSSCLKRSKQRKACCTGVKRHIKPCRCSSVLTVTLQNAADFSWPLESFHSSWLLQTGTKGNLCEFPYDILHITRVLLHPGTPMHQPGAAGRVDVSTAAVGWFKTTPCVDPVSFPLSGPDKTRRTGRGWVQWREEVGEGVEGQGGGVRGGGGSTLKDPAVQVWTHQSLFA